MRLRPIQALRARLARRRMAGPKLVRAFADVYTHASFAEIGANDGDQHDFLRPYVEAGGWTGLMVEPVPYVFNRLQRRYGAIPGVTLVNVAVGPAEGRFPFFHLAEAPGQGLPQWYDGIGSFSKEEVLSHRDHIPDIDGRLVESVVDTVPLDVLCERHGIDRLDLILLDTEGYDWEIIRGLDLDAWSPRLLIYEHFHLSPGDRRAAREHMAAAGYETLEEHFDTFCLDASVDDGLTRMWRHTSPAVPGVAAYEVAG